MTRRRLYTFEICQELAVLHPTRSKLSKNVPNAYTAARRAGWLDLLYPPETRPEQPETWTKERIAEVSKLYASRSEMRKSPHQWALKIARKNKWWDVLPPSAIGVPKKWTKEACIFDAANYTYKEAWVKNSPGAYNAAHKNGWADECCLHMQTPPREIKWTKAACIDDAANYSYRAEWQKANPSAYGSALRNNWLTECCAHMELKTKWTRETIEEVAKECTSGKHMVYLYPGAHDAARRNGWRDLIPIAFDSKNDKDVFYLWKAKDTYYNGVPVYKFGITSKRLGKKRIRDVAKSAGLLPELLLYVPLSQAPSIERTAASLGIDPSFDRFDGYTEFRAYSQEDIAQILAAVHDAGEFIL